MTVTMEDRSPVPARDRVVFRRPEPSDAHAVREMVDASEELDNNSEYYYMIWFRDFARTSMVADLDGEVIGFLSGYRRPDRPDTYFVWQEAVTPRHGIPFLGVKLFDHAVEQELLAGARYVEATVSEANTPIVMVLKRFAKRWGADIDRSVLFTSADFGGGHHEETLYRIGPVAP
ncbi:diaminobutyrate acetyltransferase [Nocardiopsis quinghaiensis]|uniref:diaminobutyrate acetyltransferase n=1 Tax=Nocardiopsis quinghaiensis TaxID=464995 RepID=UPI0012396BB7|nr:diaminobutyrate acetyltransferase [Nocardiopsis quinghaiensis]